jgi:hypothetical protein
MTQNQKIQGKFFPFTQETYQKLKEAKLTAAEWRLWAYLVTLIPFGDRYQDLPDTLTILEECEIGKSTFWTALAKLQDFGFFDFQDKGFSARNLIYPSVEIEQKTANFAESKKLDNCPKNWTPVQEIGQPSEKLDSRSPEPLQDKVGDRSQTLKNIQTSQIAEGEEKIFSDPDFSQQNGNKPIKPEEAVEICTNIIKKQIETTTEEAEKEEKKIDSKVGVKGNFSARQVSPNKISENSIDSGNSENIEKHRQKLESLGIEWRRVKTAIARAHESQILGAIAHVEANWEEIKDPSAVFLYQMPKQKIEQLGGGKVFRAAEMGYTLDDVKRRYPNNWREAAAHFGIDLSLEEADG